MPIRPILTWPDPRLAARCDPVKANAELGGLIADMFDTMYAAPGRGLAAPQLGVMQRVFVTDTTWKDGPRSPMIFLNPRIVAHSETVARADEACLSLPGISVAVARPDWVVLAWSGADGAGHEGRFDGFAAACVQHELDHLDGIVTLDRLSPENRARAETELRAGQP